MMPGHAGRGDFVRTSDRFLPCGSRPLSVWPGIFHGRNLPELLKIREVCNIIISYQIDKKFVEFSKEWRFWKRQK